MRILTRTAALAAAVATTAMLAACTPPAPEPTEPPTSTQPTSSQPTAPEPTSEPTAQPAQASTPLPTPEVTIDEDGMWAAMTSHCETIGTLMRVDDHPQPLVNGLYAPVDLHDSGPRDGARGEVRTRMDGSTDMYLVAEGDDVVSIGQRFCAPHLDYIAWLNHRENAAAMQLPVVGLPINLRSSEPSQGEAGPVPTESP